MKTFYSCITEVEAPVEHVWALLSRVVDWPQWLPTFRSVVPLQNNSETLKEGASFLLKQPRLPLAKWIVVGVEPNSSFMWESRSFGLRTVANHRLRQKQDNKTEVELSVEFCGAFSWLAAFVARRLVPNYLKQEADALVSHARLTYVHQLSKRNGASEIEALAARTVVDRRRDLRSTL